MRCTCKRFQNVCISLLFFVYLFFLYFSYCEYVRSLLWHWWLLTVEHVLTSCSAYKNIRQKYYQKYYHHSQLSHIVINICRQHTFNYLPLNQPTNLLVGDRKGIQPVKTVFQQSSKFLLWGSVITWSKHQRNRTVKQRWKVKQGYVVNKVKSTMLHKRA